ncbi:hypothetical protein [Streptomyces sp. NRRL S-37]|uniref:hypothetical protein n=1 Tax=Streptomyces sp. NRRL S-37 TaxID=1463903 RepID=UPI000690B2DB|nr:hypothetical protein [Streptomyces sp. NRRL S-37]
MNLDEADLLPGEILLLTKNANAVVDVQEAGLSRFAFDGLMWTVGMGGQEAIGGRLHLTNYRLVFKSHRFNRLRGKFSIFLPTIRSVRNASFGPTRQVEVMTGIQSFAFVLWGVPRFMTAIEEARRTFAPAWSPGLAHAMMADLGKVGEGLKIVHRLEAANIVLTCLTPGDAITAISRAISPDSDAIEIAGALQLVDLLACIRPPSPPSR